jgi:hypothetical protein
MPHWTTIAFWVWASVLVVIQCTCPVYAAPKTDVCSVQVTPRLSITGSAGISVIRVGVKVENPVEYTCPGLIYRSYFGKLQFGAEPTNTATHESDCDPGEPWDAPPGRYYGVPSGSWTFEVEFCKHGVADDHRSCRGGGSQKKSETVEVH